MSRAGLLWLLLGVAVPAVAEPVVSAGGRLVFRPTPGAESLAARLAARADEDREAVAHDLGRAFDDVVDVRVAVDEKSYRESLPPGSAVPVWAHAAAFPEQNLIVLEASGDDVARQRLKSGLLHVAAAHLASGEVPRWFLEGLAMVRADAAWREGASLREAASAGRLHRFASLGRDFPSEASEAALAFAQSADFVTWLVSRSGEVAVQELLRSVAAGVPFDSAVVTHLGAPVRELEQRWSTGLVRWELLGRMVAESPAWWAVFGMAIAYAFARVRRRRRSPPTDVNGEADERRMPDHVFTIIPAIWADIPAPVDPVPHKDDLESSATAASGAVAASEEDEEEEFRSRLAAAAQPRKPTIH